MDQDIVTELQDLVCILSGLSRLCSQINCLDNYMAHTKNLDIPRYLALILNHQSSQYITKNPCKHQKHLQTLAQSDKII